LSDQGGAAVESVITYVMPFVALILGIGLLGEQLTVGAIAGLILIGLGAWLATRRKPPTPATISSRTHRPDSARTTRRRAISGPLATVSSGQPRLLRDIKVSSSAVLTPVCHTPSKLVMRVRFLSHALQFGPKSAAMTASPL